MKSAKNINDYLIEVFSDIYKTNDNVSVYFAPARVNLIGEHIDYNGGYVFPCALSIGTYAAVRLREDDIVRMYSVNYADDKIIQFSVDALEYDEKHKYANYPKGVIKTLIDKGYPVSKGMDIVYFGNIPNGAGLSSSASIEVLTGYMVMELNDLKIDLRELALICQLAENEYIGVKCGIMDQYAIAFGKKDSAILLNTNTIEHKYAPLKLEGYKILIMNTNKKRGLLDSKYNERRQECEKSLAILKDYLEKNKYFADKSIVAVEHIDEEQLLSGNFNCLCQLNVNMWEQCKYAFFEDDVVNKCGATVETLVKRARHAITENQRTIKAFEALKNKDLETFGRLMNESHDSLKLDYEVTGKELDIIVEAARKCKGVMGARMTGAGFGGCAIALVKDGINDGSIKEIVQAIRDEYYEKTGIMPEFYITQTGNGPCKINE